ncbi:MAG TPA: DnaJ domain-containing protein [archaeon]|nr:DnaJ domain-containing protein [archaeon]
MEVIKIKGHSVNFIPTKDSYNRRALQFKNKCINSLEELGTRRDDIEIELDGYCGRDAKATITWYFNGNRMYYEVASQKKYVDNLFILSKIIENEVELVLLNKKPIEEFIAEFREDEDVHDERKEAREFFGVSHNHKNIEEINVKYKKMARELHPDMPTGNVEKFKELNHHHKILKRELE